jgi:hypothetical protein
VVEGRRAETEKENGNGPRSVEEHNPLIQDNVVCNFFSFLQEMMRHLRTIFVESK